VRCENRNIHDTTPLILAPFKWLTWLTGSFEGAEAIVSYTTELPLTYHAVSKDVGAPHNGSPDLVEPIEANP
jgi:putative SOS response-associated peptidase YedK